MKRYKSVFKEAISKNIDKVERNIGKIIFDSISKATQEQLEEWLNNLQSEIKLHVSKSGKDARYDALKEEEWYILYRLDRSEEFKY